MLTISEAQLSALAERPQGDLQAFCLKIVKERLPHITGALDDNSLGEMVENQLRRAKRLGLSRIDDQIFYVLLSFQFAPDFDRWPAFHPILLDQRQVGSRMERLTREATDDDWREIMSSTDPTAWFSEFPP